VLGERPDDELAVPPAQPGAGRPLRGDQNQVVEGEVAAVEQPAEVLADGAGGADDGDGASHQWLPSTSMMSAPSSPNLWWMACTAVSTSSSCTTTEMRIVDVEIMSMLTPASDRAVNISAATPGWVFMPAPTSDTLPIRSSSSMPWAPISATSGWRASWAVRASVSGIVQEMSVVPSAATFCTIMSTLTLASARRVKIRAAIPGLSGTRRTVSLPSLRSWATP